MKGSKPAPEAGLTTLQKLNLTFGAGCGTMMVLVRSGLVQTKDKCGGKLTLKKEVA